MNGPRFVRWFGKMRRRIFGKPKYYNRIQWFLDEGATLEKARQALFLEKVESLRARLDANGVHGKKRKYALQTRRKNITKAIREYKKSL